jgi:hypothetical protein
MKKYFTYLNDEKLQKILRLVGWVIALFFLYKTAMYNFTVISLNSPQEYRDDSSIILTCRLLDGKPIYTAETMPMYHNGYGFFYSYVSAPFAKIFGCDYTVHKAVSFLFALGAFILLYILAYRFTHDHLLSLLGILILYHHFAWDYSESGPHPDSVGYFIFLVSALIPWVFNFSPKSLVVTIFTSILGFYTKLYFIVGAVYVGSYLFLKGYYKKSIVFVIGFISVLSITALIVNWKYDFYFFSTLITNIKITKYLWWYQLLETRDYILGNYSFVIFFLISGAGGAFVILKKWWKNKKNIRVLLPDYFTYALLLSLYILISKLAGNPGGYLQYYNFLVSPFIYLVVMKWSTVRTKSILLLLLLLNIITLYTSVNYFVDTKKIRQNWQELETYFDKYTEIFNSPPFALYAYKRGLFVYDAGHTEYFRMGTPGKSNVKVFKVAIERYDSLLRMYESKIYNNQFDALIYWVPYANIIEDLLYKGFLREYVKTHYVYGGTKEWVTALRTTQFEVWLKPTKVE